jgi:hypothetical protein
MIFHKKYQELKVLMYLILVVCVSIYIHQGYIIEALEESFVYTFLLPILMTHHLINQYSFSKGHMSFYGLRTKRIYFQTWYHVLYKSFIDVLIWFLFTNILFQFYMGLSNISIVIMYDFLYIYAVAIITLSLSNHVIISYVYVILFSFRVYIPFHLLQIYIPLKLHTAKDAFILVVLAVSLWTLKMIFIRYNTH